MGAGVYSGNVSAVARKPLVFVSYAYTDEQDALLGRLLSRLKTDDRIRVWDARDRLHIGDSIITALDQAITASGTHLFIVPRATGLARSVNYELQLIYRDQLVKQRGSLIPIRLHADSAPLMIDSLLQVDLRENFEIRYEDLVQLILGANQESLLSFDLTKKVDSAPIIEVSDLVGERLVDYFARHPHEMRVMDRRLFEEFVAELFAGFGYEVELTKQTRDKGRDIIAVKRAEVNVRYLIECKRPDPGGYVGVRPVRELFGVKHDEGATKAILATTAHFSKDALLFFENHKWELEPRDYDGLIEWLSRFKAYRQVGGVTANIGGRANGYRAIARPRRSPS
jgi:HJR/Mrr/RecB family endonuclease